MQDDALDLFAAAGYPCDPEAVSGRKLVFTDYTGAFHFILAKPADVPIYVEYGAADLGIAGQDVLREGTRDLYEPLALGFGHCRLVLAGPAEARDRNLRLETGVRVASKYPRLAREYLQQRGLAAEIIPLTGSVELAPTVGLADLLIDLVDTGRTLRENGLVELATIIESQAALVVNRASHRVKFAAVRDILERLSAVVDRRQATKEAR